MSKSGIEEEGLNLQIAKKLEKALLEQGFDVIMTREDNNSIADSDKQSTIRETKKSDINNRVKIANNSDADIMVSIHMNKFDQSSSWGWQIFYSKNSDEGKRLATYIKQGIDNSIDRPNKREIQSLSGIKIIDQTLIPVVIVECGFLSNEEDLRLLQTDEYQNQIVAGIMQGIETYYQNE